MGTRNIRILRSQVPGRLDELIGKHAHIVLFDGRTHSGKVLVASTEGVQVQDTNARWTNLRRHTHRIPLDQIMEVILDNVTDF